MGVERMYSLPIRRSCQRQKAFERDTGDIRVCGTVTSPQIHRFEPRKHVGSHSKTNLVRMCYLGVPSLVRGSFHENPAAGRV